MSKQADEEVLFGRLDLSSLVPGGVPAEVLEHDQCYQEMRQDLESQLQNYRRGDSDLSLQLEALTTEMERYRKALGDLLEHHPKAQKNPHYRDRIRATVYEHPNQYRPCGNGVYMLNYDVA